MEFIKPGMFTTVQDLGRGGLAHLGFPPGGVMDRASAIQANLALGNDAEAALLEITLFGPRIKFREDLRIALQGGRAKVFLDGESRDTSVIEVKKGQVLDIPLLEKGCRTYLAVEGGIDVPEVFGAKSTLSHAAIGGFEGRALIKGDVLKVLAVDDNNERPTIELKASSLPSNPQLKCRQGPEFDWFSNEDKVKFLTSTYTVSQNSNRMGMRLEDVQVFTEDNFAMFSSALFPGVVQIPHDGNPIIILRDGPTAGGYPRVVILDDSELDVLAQLRPGDKLGFEFLD